MTTENDTAAALAFLAAEAREAYESSLTPWHWGWIAAALIADHQAGYPLPPITTAHLAEYGNDHLDRLVKVALEPADCTPQPTPSALRAVTSGERGDQSPGGASSTP